MSIQQLHCREECTMQSLFGQFWVKLNASRYISLCQKQNLGPQ